MDGDPNRLQGGSVLVGRVAKAVGSMQVRPVPSPLGGPMRCGYSVLDKGRCFRSMMEVRGVIDLADPVGDQDYQTGSDLIVTVGQPTNWDIKHIEPLCLRRMDAVHIA